MKSLAFVFLLGVALWFCPTPSGLDVNAWHLFSILVATLVGVTLAPLPVGAMSLLGLSATILTQTLSLEQALSAFSSDVVWLVVFAFVIARGFIKTGLGSRIAYYLIILLGKSSLGLSYGLVFTEFILSPAIPSMTARGGGVTLPIALSLASEYQSLPNHESSRRIGAFLINVCFQANVITSAVFVTAMAGNPLVTNFARELGIHISWTGWATAAIVPGLLNLILVPLLIYALYRPEIRKTPEAPALARQKLAQMGPLSRDEIMMIIIFGTLLTLWIFGPFFKISATTAGMVGGILLLLSRVLQWDDILKEKEAWNSLISFGTLLMMTTFLGRLGMMNWVNIHLTAAIAGDINTILIGTLLAGIYVYIHYLFASITAHATFLYTSFLTAFLAIGAPPFVAAIGLAILTNLSSGLTTYGNVSAPVFFGAGYVPIQKWLQMGFIMTTVNVLLWASVGGVWWKFLGWW